jgi:hypothetical protein
MKLTKKQITFAKKEDVKKVFDKIHITPEEFQEELALSDFLYSLEKELDKRHMTKYALAKKSGLKPQVVARVFNNENAEISTLSKMAHGAGGKLELNFVFGKN